MDPSLHRKDRRRLLTGMFNLGTVTGLSAASFRVPLAQALPNQAKPLSGLLNIDLSGLEDAQSDTQGTALGAWVRIARSGAITLLCNHAEMGQGVSTALAALLAEELEVPLSSVYVRMAPPAPQYMNPRFNRQLTGESASMRGMFTPLRQAGAQVRDQLLRAAAQRFKVSEETLKVLNAAVVAPDGRSLSYGVLAQEAALLMPREQALKAAADWKLIGKPLARIDTAAKVNGTAVYGIDVRLPGLMYAAIRMGPVLGSSVQRVDDRAARAMAGVLQVVSTGDGVAVVARSWWIAHKACALLKVQWNPGPSAGRSSASVKATFARALSQGAPILAQEAVGDVAAAMQGAHRRHRFEYWSHSLAHATMEPMNFTAFWDGQTMRLIGPTQYPDSAQAAVASALSLPREKIAVQTTYLGCGFGRRVETDVEVQAAKIAFALKAPVKLLWSREEDMTHGFYRPMAVNVLEVATDRQGLPIALDWMISSQSIKTRIWGWDEKRLDGTMVEYCDPPYRIAHHRFRAVHSDAGLRVGFMRSVSHAFNVFANESMIDELAVLAGRDPLEYRLALVDTGSRFERVLKAVAALSSWQLGPAPGRSRGLALMYGYGSVLAMVSEVSLSQHRVKVHRVFCAADVGQVINAAGVVPQIESSVVFGLGAALMQEITFRDGQVQQKNFDTYPIPRMRDVPSIQVQVLASREHPGGIGEPGAALIQAATANAVSGALKRRVRKLPMTALNLRAITT